MRPAQRRLVRRSVERRNLHSLRQLLGSLGGGERLDDGAERQSQIGHGNRSEKIRTYNQPQDRVTDHRIGFNSTYNGVLLGDQLGTVIEALAAAERAEKLAQAV